MTCSTELYFKNEEDYPGQCGSAVSISPQTKGSQVQFLAKGTCLSCRFLDVSLSLPSSSTSLPFSLKKQWEKNILKGVLKKKKKRLGRIFIGKRFEIECKWFPLKPDQSGISPLS